VLYSQTETHFFVIKLLIIMAMLEYSKTVLEKVSFNRELFRKELEKSRKMLKEDEIEILHKWVRTSLADKYPDIISEIVDTYPA